MNKWLLRFSQVLGLAGLLLMLTGALVPAGTTGKRKTSLALRQIGHDYRAGRGDLTSRIPVVRERADGSLLLRLEQEIDYDTITRIARAVLITYGIRQDYTLALEDCASGEIFLGSFWSTDKVLMPGNTVACTGRDQDARCANVSLLLHAGAEAGVPPVSWLLGGLGALLLFAGPLSRKKGIPVPTEQATPNVPDNKTPVSLRLTAACSFNETSQLLTVAGREYQLTHREGHLLSYLVARPNEVLRRQEIHDAVWGLDGIITGRSLDVFVSRLRKKLADDSGMEIKTVHGVGYQCLIKRPTEVASRFLGADAGYKAGL